MSFESRPRTIIHIDLDAFYCQVEQKRHNIPRETPCAVQQWEGLIAVNYAARAAGVTRHMRVAEARRICSQLRTVHVETIGEAGGSLSPGRSQAGPGGGAARRNEAKASLQPYRQASGEIMRVLASSLGPNCLLEKASVDEAFLDVTAMVEEELRRRVGEPATRAPGGQVPDEGAHPRSRSAAAAQAEAVAADLELGLGGEAEGGGMGLQGAVHGTAEAGLLEEEGGGGDGLVPGWLLGEARHVCEASVVIGGPPRLLSEVDRRLVVGALIALRLRRAVRAHLDFTCSAGVATNKLLAKVGSARNKPDKQTLVLPRGVKDLMQDMPLGKLRGLGGKLGQALEQHFGATTAGQVQQLPLDQLQRHLGDRTGVWLSQIVRGQCAEPVTPKDKPKSLLSCKSFEPTRDPADLARWLTILAEELVTRCGEDEAAHRRRARTLVLHYRGVGPRERSVRCAMPQYGKEGASATVIAKACMEMLRRQPDALPCSRLAIAATEFDDPPAAGAKSITRFFAAPGPQAKRAAAQALPSGAPSLRPQTPPGPHSPGGVPPDGAMGGAVAQYRSWGGRGEGGVEEEEGGEEEEGEAEALDDRVYGGGCEDDEVGVGGPGPGARSPQHGRPWPLPAQQQLGRWHDFERPGKRQRPDNEPIRQQHQQRGAGAGVGEGGQDRVSRQQQQHLHQQHHGDQQPSLQDASPVQQHQGQSQRQRRQQQRLSRDEHEDATPALLAGWLEDPGAAQRSGGSRPSESAPAAQAGLAVGGAGAAGWGGVLHYRQEGPSGSGPRTARDSGTPQGHPGGSGAVPGARGAGDAVALDAGGTDPCMRAGDNPGGGGHGLPRGPAEGSDGHSARAVADGDSDVVQISNLGDLGDVDLEEQRRILHDIALARLRSVGRAAGGAGGAAGAGGRGGSGGRRGGGRGGAGRDRGRGLGAGAGPVKGQMRLTALLQPQSQAPQRPPKR